MRIAIVGLGPAGASLTHFLRGTRHDVSLYDYRSRLGKPCGNAFAPNIIVPRNLIRTTVKRLVVNFGKKQMVLNKGPLFNVVDKPGLMQRLVEGYDVMREMAAPEILLKHYDVVVDARGPSAVRNPSIPTPYQVKISDPKWPQDEAFMNFDMRRMGYLWIFPQGGDNVAIGAGYLRDERKYAVDIVKRYVDQRNGKILSVEGAPIATKLKLDVGAGNLVRIGEAAGFIHHITMEGNRPAVESAFELSRTINDLDAYRERAQRLFRMVLGSAWLSKHPLLAGMFVTSTRVWLTMRSLSLLRTIRVG